MCDSLKKIITVALLKMVHIHWHIQSSHIVYVMVIVFLLRTVKPRASQFRSQTLASRYIKIVVVSV